VKKIAITGGSGFIGTNLMEFLLNCGDSELLNLDHSPPKIPSHRSLWTKCDLLNQQDIIAALQAFEPTQIVHLGGRTDMDGKTVDDYAANHRGTQNLVEVIQNLHSVERVIFTSSQFVVGPGHLPKSDLDFRPHTIYGQSKVLSEQIVRSANLGCIWTIIRPTNIWGPWHPRYPNEFWRVLKQGRYLHPGGQRVRRSYGYVGTIIQQICVVLESPSEMVDKEVFYVGDPPIDLFDWANAFSLELRQQPVRVVPRPLLRGLAMIGDIVILSGGKFPIYTSRYRSMTESYVTPMDKTFEILGQPSIPLHQGVKETASWLRSSSSFWD
jgi:nucleoside-diphosphate-sugar epimerase